MTVQLWVEAAGAPPWVAKTLAVRQLVAGLLGADSGTVTARLQDQVYPFATILKAA